MKQFGRVVSIYVPFDLSKKNSRIFAFVEYSTFKEAEKAIREINSSKKDGFDIVANFAHTKVEQKVCPTENVPQLPACIQSKKIVEKEVQQVPISINLESFKFDDIIEKVSFFEYMGPIDANDNEQKYLMKYAGESKGEYDEEKVSISYDFSQK